VPFSELWHNVNELPAAKQGLIVARRAIEADDIAGLEAWAAENSAVINECGPWRCWNVTCGDIANNLLAFAAYFGKFDAMRVLLRHGADPNDRYDYEPLCYAAMAGHTQSIRILVDAGADVNGGRHGSRPLLFAAERAKLDAARLLLRLGADILYKNEDGQDAIDLSVSELDMYTGPPIPDENRIAMRDFLCDVLERGGWHRYYYEPRIQLLVLRELCKRKRAAPLSPACRYRYGVFDSKLPNKALWRVLEY